MFVHKYPMFLRGGGWYDIRYGNYEEMGHKGILINNILLLAHNCTHKCGFLKAQPLFIVFRNYLKPFSITKLYENYLSILMVLYFI